MPRPNTLVLNAGDVHGTALALKRTYSDPKVLRALSPTGCLGESTSEFVGSHDVMVRSSAEVYPDAGSASHALHSFVETVARQHARDHSATQIGDESAFFVTAILARRRRFMSFAACWRLSSNVGKITVVGPAERVDKALAECLALTQAARMPTDPLAAAPH